MELLKNLAFLFFVWLISCLLIASCTNHSYAKDLSKSNSVTPLRKSGFIVPKNCIGSQSMHIQGASITAMHTRLQSLYEGMTPQNKPMANMWGGSICPRVNPLASLLIGDNSKTQNQIGGITYA